MEIFLEIAAVNSGRNYLLKQPFLENTWLDWSPENSTANTINTNTVVSNKYYCIFFMRLTLNGDPSSQAYIKSGSQI